MTGDRAHRLICLSLLLAAMSVSAQQRVYKWVDANGVVHYSDAPPDDSQRAAAETLAVPSSAPQAAEQPVRNARAETTRVAAPPERQPSAAVPAPAQTQGSDCSSPSPMKSRGQDLDLDELNYEPPDPLTTDEIESFESVIRSMAYRWSGTDVGFACDGAARRPLSRTVVAEGRAANAVQFVLDSTISSRDSSRRELLRIELRDQRLWVNRGYASLLSVSDRVLAFAYVERRAGVVWERSWRIELDGRRNMSVDNVTYTNGALTESSAWETRKPY